MDLIVCNERYDFVAHLISGSVLYMNLYDLKNNSIDTQKKKCLLVRCDLFKSFYHVNRNMLLPGQKAFDIVCYDYRYFIIDI